MQQQLRRTRVNIFGLKTFQKVSVENNKDIYADRRVKLDSVKRKCKVWNASIQGECSKFIQIWKKYRNPIDQPHLAQSVWGQTNRFGAFFLFFFLHQNTTVIWIFRNTFTSTTLPEIVAGYVNTFLALINKQVQLHIWYVVSVA